MEYICPGCGYGINNRGVVVGEYGFGLGTPFFYHEDDLYLLGDLGGGFGAALSINGRNQVVGVSLDVEGRFRAFVRSDIGGMEDLNALVSSNSGWILVDAVGINESGQIVGSGRYNGKAVACRLDPLPRLKIELDGTNVVISWSAIGAGWVLEAGDALVPMPWQAVPGATNSPVVLPAVGPGRIFRLAQYPTLEPRLNISRSGTDLVVSWAPPWPDCILESSPALSPASSSPIPGATNSPVALPTTASPLFFRLRK